MDFLISFFRDTLDGGLYFFVVIVCLILIFLIFGFLLKKSRLAREEAGKTVIIADSNGNPVDNREVVENTNINAATNVSGGYFITDETDKEANVITNSSNFIDFDSVSENNTFISDKQVPDSFGTTEQSPLPVQSTVSDTNSTLISNQSSANYKDDTEEL